jgi:hypothetical protein
MLDDDAWRMRVHYLLGSLGKRAFSERGSVISVYSFALLVRVHRQLWVLGVRI